MNFIHGVFDVSKKEVIFTTLDEKEKSRFINLANDKNLIGFRCSGEKLMIEFYDGVQPNPDHFYELQFSLIKRGILEIPSDKPKKEEICSVIHKTKFTTVDLGKGRIIARCKNPHGCKLNKVCFCDWK